MKIKQIFAPTCGALVATWALAGAAQAALAPQYQNPKDLAVMVDFVHAHPQVMAQLRSIDLEHFTVHYGWDKECRAVFGREKQEHPPGWVGPQAPLVFISATCPVD